MLERSLRLALALELALYALLAHFFAATSPAVSALLAVAGVLVLRAILIAFSYACAWTWQSPAPRLGARRTLLMVLAEYAVSVLCFTVLFPFERLWMGKDGLFPATGEGPAARRPVLLIHGYGCSRAAWWWLRARLGRTGRAVATINLEPVFTGIDDYVAPLARRIDEVLAATGSERLILVAHSMGGLVASAYLQRFGGQRVASLVTLGTPFRGSHLARFGRGTNARQMRVDSVWLQSLANPSASVDSIVVYSPHDNFVLPQTNLLLPGAETRRIDGLGHLAMLYSPRVARVLESTLAASDSRVLQAGAKRG